MKRRELERVRVYLWVWLTRSRGTPSPDMRRWARQLCDHVGVTGELIGVSEAGDVPRELSSSLSSRLERDEPLKLYALWVLRG